MSFWCSICRVFLFLNDCLLVSFIKMNVLCLGKKICSVNHIIVYNTESNKKVIFVSRFFNFQAIFERKIKFVNYISILFIMRNNF